MLGRESKLAFSCKRAHSGALKIADGGLCRACGCEICPTKTAEKVKGPGDLTGHARPSVIKHCTRINFAVGSTPISFKLQPPVCLKALNLKTSGATSVLRSLWKWKITRLFKGRHDKRCLFRLVSIS